MKLPLKVIQLYKNEAALTEKASKGNRKAQQRVFELHSGKMLSVCRQYISDTHFAEEVMLGGFMKVFRYLPDFRNEGSFEGWIRRIMIRECISFYRKKKPREVPMEDMAKHEGISNAMDNDFDIEYLQQLIDALPEGYRMVFVMYAVEGYKHNEIAAMLGISESTSKTQLFKARKMLQRQIMEFNKISNGGT